MRVYRWVWLAACTALVTLGLLVGLAVSPPAVATVAVWAVIVGGIITFLLWCDAEHEPGDSGAAFVLRGAALSALAAGAAVGLMVALGGDFFLVALLVTVSAPQLVGRYLRWLGSAPRPSAAQFGAAMSAAAWASEVYVAVTPDAPSGSAGSVGNLWSLSDEELCQRWQTSCVTLPAQASVIARIGAAEERRGLLEEVERRNPAGYWAWVISDAPRSATLLRYLSGTPGTPPRIDWDALLS